MEVVVEVPQAVVNVSIWPGCFIGLPLLLNSSSIGRDGCESLQQLVY